MARGVHSAAFTLYIKSTIIKTADSGPLQYCNGAIATVRKVCERMIE